jgi:cyclase
MKSASKRCFSPIVFGGGIKNLEDAKKCFQNGADKISINSICLSQIEIISEFANTFGKQSIVVSIDVKKIDSNYVIYNSKNDSIAEKDLFSYVKDVEKKGAGEILLNSVDRDGAGEGFDINLINQINNLIKIPLIPCGGAGTADHISELLDKVNLSAIAAGNIFNFTERSYENIKNFLKKKGYNFR